VALYVPAGRRRRNLVLGLAGAVVVGLIVGFLLGRATHASLDDEVATVQDSARAVTARLRATPVEYAQERRGSSEFSHGGTVLDSLADARRSLRDALDDAVWLGPAQRREATAALDVLVSAARAETAARRYRALVDTSANRIDVVFGLR
jgi:hypothetical protein